MNKHDEFIQAAIDASMIQDGGGPFGAVVVRDNKIISTGWNRVTGDNDPTAHAEIMAIRKACKLLDTFSLKGCVLYSSCEPCPMCEAAIRWARIEMVYYASKEDKADAVGFDDRFFRQTKTHNLIHLSEYEEQAEKAFEQWRKNPNKEEY